LRKDCESGPVKIPRPVGQRRRRSSHKIARGRADVSRYRAARQVLREAEVEIERLRVEAERRSWQTYYAAIAAYGRGEATEWGSERQRSERPRSKAQAKPARSAPLDASAEASMEPLGSGTPITRISVKTVSSGSIRHGPRGGSASVCGGPAEESGCGGRGPGV